MNVKQHIEQVQDGTHYKGKIDFEGKVLEYEIKFGVPIPNLDAHVQRKKQSAEGLTDEFLRGVFQISIVKRGQRIEIARDVFGFLISLIGVGAVNFYNNPQTRGSSESGVNELLRPFGGGLSVSGTRELDIPIQKIPSNLLN